MTQELPGGEKGFRTPGCPQGGTCFPIFMRPLSSTLKAGFLSNQPDTKPLGALCSEHPNGLVTLGKDGENCHLIFCSPAGPEGLNLACCKLLWYWNQSSHTSINSYVPADLPAHHAFLLLFGFVWLFDTGSSQMSQTGCATPALPLGLQTKFIKLYLNCLVCTVLYAFL